MQKNNYFEYKNHYQKLFNIKNNNEFKGKNEDFTKKEKNIFFVCF